MVRTSKSMEEEIQRNEKRIASLEEELRVSRANEKSLGHKIKSLEEEIQKLKDENKMLKEQLQQGENEKKEMIVRIENLEKENEDRKAREQFNEYILVVVQISSTIEKNMCKFVLGKDFNYKKFYKYDKIGDEIRELKHPDDRNSAGRRRMELEKKIPWDKQWVKNLMNSLNFLKRTRNDIAHPELSRENIQRATEVLKEKKELDDEDVKNVTGLKSLWETSEELLQTSSAEGQGKKGQKRGADANKSARGHAGLPKRARGSQTSSAERGDHFMRSRNVMLQDNNKTPVQAKSPKELERIIDPGTYASE